MASQETLLHSAQPKRIRLLGRSVAALIVSLIFAGVFVLAGAPMNVAHAACTSPAGEEGEQIYNDDHNVMQYCDGTDWTAMRGGDGSGASSMVDGWPDSIQCSRSDGTVFIMMLNLAPLTGGDYFYAEAWNGASVYLRYSPSGSFVAETIGMTNDCDTKSISQLYTDGQAFNFVGGGSGGSGWEDVSLSDTDNFDRSCAYRADLNTSPVRYATSVDTGFITFMDFASSGNDTQFQVLSSAKGVYSIRTEGTGSFSGSYTVTKLEKNCGGGGSDTLSGLSCTDGQVPAWNNAGTAWECADGGSGGSSASTMTATWPDAIECTINGTNGYKFIQYRAEAGGAASYSYENGANQGQVAFSNISATGNQTSASWTITNCDKTISQLYTDGKAFNFVGGGSGGGAGSDVAFSVHKDGTNQTVAAGTPVLLTWPVEKFDTNDDFASNRFTPTVAGKYIINLGVSCVTSNCYSYIYKNGVRENSSGDHQGGGIAQVNVIIEMNGSSDYIEAYVNSGGTSIEGSTYTYMTGALLGGGGSGGSDGGGSGNVSASGDLVGFDAQITGSNQAISSAVWTDIVFNGEQRDDGDVFDPSTGKFTAPSDGYYNFSSTVHVVSSDASFAGVLIQTNHSSTGGQRICYAGDGKVTTVVGSVVSCSGSIYLTAGTIVESIAYSNSPGGDSLYLGATDFSGFKVGSGASVSGTGGSADDLGDHTATEALDMATFDILNAGSVELETITGAGAPLGSSGNATLDDADGNTKIQVEESANEDKIRFDTAGTERMIIDEYGNVGIGTDAPSAKLDVVGGHIALDGGHYLYPNGTSDENVFVRGGNAGQLILGASATGLYQQVPGPNYYTVSTSGGATSDATVKENVENIPSALQNLEKLRGVYFDFTEEFLENSLDQASKGKQVGVIAQEVQAVYPEIVHTDAQGRLSVSYEKLVAPLIEAVKELSSENEKLQDAVVKLSGGEISLADLSVADDTTSDDDQGTLPQWLLILLGLQSVGIVGLILIVIRRKA